jgi:hypothetical protein
VTDGDHKLPRRKIEDGALTGLPREVSGLPAADNPLTESARRAIMDCMQKSCVAPLSEALAIQSKHSGGFMTTPECKQGSIGADFTKIMTVYHCAPAELCSERGWRFVTGFEPEKPEDLSKPELGLNLSAPIEIGEIGRNDPCTCGRGKKYKKCCGASGASRAGIRT